MANHDDQPRLHQARQLHQYHKRAKAPRDPAQVAQDVRSVIAENPDMDLDALDPDGLTALMRLALEGQREAVEVMLDAGASPNVCGVHNSNALILAVVGEDKPTVRLLLERGADPDIAKHTKAWPRQAAQQDPEMDALFQESATFATQ